MSTRIEIRLIVIPDGGESKHWEESVTTEDISRREAISLVKYMVDDRLREMLALPTTLDDALAGERRYFSPA